FQRPTEMHRSRAPALRGAPWHRSAQGPVDLEHAGAVAIALERIAIRCGEARTGDPLQTARRRIEEIRARRTELLQRLDPIVGDDVAAKRAQIGSERIDDALAPAARQRP